MRCVLLSKSDEAYLNKCAVELGLAYGIICGQLAEADKYVVVHLAKNGEEDVDMPDMPSAGNVDATNADNISNGSDITGQQTVPNVEDIDTQALMNQWISASKMLPGSFTVLGAFVAGIQAEIGSETTFREAKKVLYDMHNLLIQGNSYCSTLNDLDHRDYLFLAYSTVSQRAVCKSYSHATKECKKTYFTANIKCVLCGGIFTPLDCRFVEKPFEWHTFESNYELDDVFPILDSGQKVNIERHFQHTIDLVRKNLDASEIFIQNELVDDGQTLDDYVKRKNNALAGVGPVGKKTARQGSLVSTGDSFKANIYLPVKCDIIAAEPIAVRQFSGTVRFAGIISSRIWCSPRNTFANVKRFVRDDVLRSLTARIQVYCDGLTEPQINNDSVFISEPPRRVYFNLPGPTATSAPAYPVQFSEYLFRGEAPTVAVAQAKQILDLDIEPECIIADVESLPDDDMYSNISSDGSEMIGPTTKAVGRDVKRSMYMLGIAVALIVLLGSILMHIVLQP